MFNGDFISNDDWMWICLGISVLVVAFIVTSIMYIFFKERKESL